MKTDDNRTVASSSFVLFWLRLKLKIRHMFWRGRVCPGTGKRCKCIWCNSGFDANCYVTHARSKENGGGLSGRAPLAGRSRCHVCEGVRYIRITNASPSILKCPICCGTGEERSGPANNKDQERGADREETSNQD